MRSRREDEGKLVTMAELPDPAIVILWWGWQGRGPAALPAPRDAGGYGLGCCTAEKAVTHMSHRHEQ